MRRPGIALACVLGFLLVGWVAIHRIPWLGPAIADGARAVVGPGPVAWVEDVAYSWQDRYNRWRHGDDAPHSYWEVPTAAAAAGPPAPAGSATSPHEAPSLPPPAVVPPRPSVAAKGDGIWVPASTTLGTHGKPILYKTQIHPDHERPYTVLAIVAMEVSEVRVHAVPGTVEPRGEAIPAANRSGMIPPEQRDALLAAFNGGFQTIHGGYSMMVDGKRLGAPLQDACTVALYRDGQIAVRSWPRLAADESKMVAFRQTPHCLVEDGRRHPELENPYATQWGAVVGGGTVIRRSGLGLSKDGRVLFFGMGDALTARSLADGMAAAGAHDVAQLDVNHVFPRFVFFGRDSKGEVAATEPLCRGFSFSADDYLNTPMARDFFYVTRRAP